MAMNLRGLRVYALGLAHRAFRDIQRDNFRQLRNYVDMCAFLSKGKGHRLFFERAQEVLEQTDSLYYPLIQRAISTVSEDALCTFGVNLGIDALTSGAGQLRQLAATEDQQLPWLVLANAGSAGLAQAIPDGEKRGLYCWCLFAADPAEAWQAVELARQNAKCAFALVLPSALVTPELVAQLGQAPNLATVLWMQSPEFSEETHAAVRLLRDARLLYGIGLDLDDGEAQQVLQREWLSVAAQHALFCTFTHRRMSEGAAKVMVEQIYRMRLSTGAPLLLLSWEEDTAYTSRSISPGACVRDLRAQ